MKASSVRRRTKAQFRADKAEEERKELETKTKLARFAEMEQQLAQSQQQSNYTSQIEAQLGNLVDQGIIKQAEDGNLWPVDDPMERQ